MLFYEKLIQVLVINLACHLPRHYLWSKVMTIICDSWTGCINRELYYWINTQNYYFNFVWLLTGFLSKQLILK